MESKLNIGQHISRKFNEELESVRNQVLQMGGLVEEQIARALRALVMADVGLGEQVARDDHKVNQMEVEIDERCGLILARRQPAASDLRLIVAIIKTITDLERIGDEAEKIAYLATRMAEMEKPSGNYRELENLGKHVGQMVHAALDAFARLDAEAALRITRTDETVDRDYESLLRQYITFMLEDPRTIRRVLDAIWCARALERIGDHAKNICEYVVYLVHGKDVRHISPEEAEREIHSRDSDQGTM